MVIDVEKSTIWEGGKVSFLCLYSLCFCLFNVSLSTALLIPQYNVLFLNNLSHASSQNIHKKNESEDLLVLAKLE